MPLCDLLLSILGVPGAQSLGQPGMEGQCIGPSCAPCASKPLPLEASRPEVAGPDVGGAGTFQAETKDGLEVTVLYRLRKGWFAVACRGRRMTLRRTQFAADQDEQLSRVPSLRERTPTERLLMHYPTTLNPPPVRTGTTVKVSQYVTSEKMLHVRGMVGTCTGHKGPWTYVSFKGHEKPIGFRGEHLLDANGSERFAGQLNRIARGRDGGTAGGSTTYKLHWDDVTDQGHMRPASASESTTAPKRRERPLQPEAVTATEVAQQQRRRVVPQRRGSRRPAGSAIDVEGKLWTPPKKRTSDDDPQQEKDKNFGKWTDDEHERFLRGLELYGRKWSKIANFVQSRSSVQVRTHAQGYLLGYPKPRKEGSSMAAALGLTRLRDSSTPITVEHRGIYKADINATAPVATQTRGKNLANMMEDRLQSALDDEAARKRQRLVPRPLKFPEEERTPRREWVGDSFLI